MRCLSLLLWLLPAAFAQSGFCDQPFAPAQPGWEWQYRVSGGNTPGPYTLRKQAVTPTGFDQVRRDPQGERKSSYRCGPEGIVPVEFGGQSRFNFNGSPVMLELEVINAKGVSIPDYDQWAVGGTWKFTHDLKGQGTYGGVRFNLTGTSETVYRVVAQETVSVPAGRFNAYKVQVTTQVRVTAKLGLLSFPFNNDIQNTAWYAEGVGLVRSVQGEAVTELTTLKK